MNKSTATTIPVDLLRKYDRPGPRYTSYPTAPVWSDKVGEQEYKEALVQASHSTDKAISIYCHIPFCRSRCYYCGCTTCITRNQDNVEAYIASLETEIDQTAKLLGDRNKVSQLHFGGGTPTYIGVEGLSRILDRIDKHFTFTDKAEKSIEVDPRVTTEEHLQFLSTRNFNRVSVGVQDFDRGVQEASGRVQSIQEVRNILDESRRLKFHGINFDLIYGLPRQTPDSFLSTLKTTIEMRPDRLAIYSFAYLPKLRANQSVIKENELPDAETKYKLFSLAVEQLTAAGYRQIGMDHFALPDDELALAQKDGRLHRNFMGYTVQSSSEMVGLGMSSIGYINDGFFQNISKIDSYKNSIQSDQFAVYRGMRLNKDDLIRQFVIASLMCNFSLQFKDLEDKFGVRYSEYFASANEKMKPFVEDELLQIDDTSLKITPVGRTFIRNIAMTFDAYLDDNGSSNKVTFSRTI